MTHAEAQQAFQRALDNMRAAHAALAEDMTTETLAVYSAACLAARRAFEAMAQSGFDRARRVAQ